MGSPRCAEAPKATPWIRHWIPPLDKRSLFHSHLGPSILDPSRPIHGEFLEKSGRIGKINNTTPFVNLNPLYPLDFDAKFIKI